MSLQLIKRSVCPPNGFRYVFPETGHIVHAWDFDSWVQSAKNHLQTNNLAEPSDLAETMQEQLCQTLEPGWCSFDDPNRIRPSTSLSWNDITNGIATFTRWIAAGCQYVAQDEADRRALVCSRCYLNVNVEGCAGCQKAVQEITRDRKSKYDFALRACGVCHCLLRAKIHFPQSILDKEQDSVQEQYPSFCWLKKDGANYRG